MVDIYKNAGLVTGIDVLEKQQGKFPSPDQFLKMSENSKQVLIEAIQKSINKLEVENKHLRQDLKRLRCRLYEQF